MSSVGKSDAPVQQVLLSGVEKIPAEAEVVKIPSVTSMSVEPVRTVPVDVVTAKQTEAKPEEKESVKKSPTISGKYRLKHHPLYEGLPTPDRLLAKNKLGVAEVKADSKPVDRVADHKTSSERASPETPVTLTTIIDAQTVYPAVFNIFVGNLPKEMSDKELETRIVVSFSKFGSCAAKVMRSQSGIPHCFVQYTTQDDADKAFAQGKGIQIGNRLCRVERSDANRTLVVWKVGHGEFTKEEMIAKFGEFGVIEEYFWLGLKESEPFVEHGRVGLVKYRIYDVAKKAINQLRSDCVWSAKYPRNGEQALKAVIAERIKNGSSMFVGNLDPRFATDKLLQDHFGQYGSIMACDIHLKRNEQDTPYTAFAFVQYVDSSDAKTAIKEEHEKEFHGRKMIVQPRHCRPALVNTNRPVRASKLANDSRVNYQRTNFMNQMPWIVPNPHYTASMFANQAFVYADAPYNMPQLGSHGNVGRAPEQSSGTASGLWSQAMPTPPMSTISQAAYLYMNGAHNNNAQFGHHTGAGHLPSHAAWRPPFYGLSGFNQSTAGDTKTSLDPFTAVAGSRHHS